MIEYSQFIKEEIELIALSDYLGLGDKLDEEGNYFINIKRIKDTKEKNFQNSYGRIQQFF